MGKERFSCSSWGNFDGLVGGLTAAKNSRSDELSFFQVADLNLNTMGSSILYCYSFILF